jgi:hypothetical protein
MGVWTFSAESAGALSIARFPRESWRRRPDDRSPPYCLVLVELSGILSRGGRSPLQRGYVSPRWWPERSASSCPARTPSAKAASSTLRAKTPRLQARNQRYRPRRHPRRSRRGAARRCSTFQVAWGRSRMRTGCGGLPEMTAPGPEFATQVVSASAVGRTRPIRSWRPTRDGDDVLMPTNAERTAELARARPR